LHAERFISAAALDRARAQFQAALAQAQAQAAQAGAARTQSGFYAVHAPYPGLVSDVAVTLGDMALPGRALLSLYDPTALRVTAAVPQSAAQQLQGGAVRAELPALPAATQMQTPRRVELLPSADAATHTQTLRAELAPGLAGVLPGQFARLWLPGVKDERGGGVWVPSVAVVRRAEMTGVYVLDAQGRALLRQVRIGRRQGNEIELLAGVAVGERVATDPQAAARAR
jgi:multidrug efflux system membrane fusion protein